MTKSLQKITEASRKGYIENSDDIEKIMSKLTKLTPAELDPKGEFFILQNIGLFLEELSITVIDKNAVCYGEFLGILEGFSLDPNGDDPELCLKIVKCNLINLMGAFRQNRSKNVTVKLFMAVTVKGYLDYLSLRAGRTGSGVHNLYRKFRIDFRRATGYTINEETTIETFLGEISRQLNIWWNIATPIEDYQKRIIGCHDALYTFFIDSFKLGFEEFFNIVQTAEPDMYDDEFAISDNDLF